MFDPKSLDDIAKRLSDSMPAGLQSLRDDMEKNFRAILQSAFNKMDLVTREEFDVQSSVLARTREKLESLEKQVAELEAKVLEK
ncbi:MAG: accessory factor UbiK family protein [Pseudomonadota bacterium]